MFKIFSQSKYTYLFFLIFIFFPHGFNKVQSSNLKISTLSSSQEYSSFKEKIKFLYLNDSFFKNETNKILDLFSNISKTSFLNLDKLKKLDDSCNIVLIVEIGTLKKDKLDQIQKYLGIYEENVIGWMYLEKDANFI